jgi:hypothetical protein
MQQQKQQQHVTNDGDGIVTSSPLPPLPPLDTNITTTEGGGNSESTGVAAAAEAAATTFGNPSISNTVNDVSNNHPLPANPSINTAAASSAFAPSSNNGLHYESEHNHQLELLSQNPPPLPQQLPSPLLVNQPPPPPPSQYSYSHYSQYPYNVPMEHQQQQYHYPLQQLHYPSYPPPPQQQPIITNNNNNQPPINTDRPTYTFSIPTQDTQSLSNRQCYIRTHLIELFIANEMDVQSRPTKGKQKIYCGQVGIRCAYCVAAAAGGGGTGDDGNDNDGGGDDTSHYPNDWTLNAKTVAPSVGGDNTTSRQRQPPPPPPPRAERAICYPQSISRIYQTVADMQRRHFEKCPYIPVVVMGTYKSLKSTRPRGENNPAHYWESSAREIGLIDSDGSSSGSGSSEEKVGIKGIVVDMERFSLQRKNVESVVVAPPPDAATTTLGDGNSGNAAATAQEFDDNDRDYNDAVVKSRATKRFRSTKEQEETIKSSVNYTATSSQLQQRQPQHQEDAPPQSSNTSSVSDAHLLASMRDGASSVPPPLNGVN